MEILKIDKSLAVLNLICKDSSLSISSASYGISSINICNSQTHMDISSEYLSKFSFESFDKLPLQSMSMKYTLSDAENLLVSSFSIRSSSD